MQPTHFRPQVATRKWLKITVFTQNPMK